MPGHKDLIVPPALTNKFKEVTKHVNSQPPLK